MKGGLLLEISLPCAFISCRSFQNKEGRIFRIASFTHQLLGSFEFFVNDDIFTQLAKTEYLSTVDLQLEIRSNQGRLELRLSGLA